MYKTPSSEFTEEDWDKFNCYMVNRFISMQPQYLELVNYVQTIPYENKEQLYNVYKEFLPKGKAYFKYIKAKKNSINKDLIEHLTQHFECSLKEAEGYISLLNKKDLSHILKQRGIDEKETKKLLK